jgi:hypothetical protein
MIVDSSSISFSVRPMQQSAFVYCKVCLEVRHFTPYDAVPQYQLENGELQEDPDHDHTDFLHQHYGHPLAALKRKKDRCWADRPLWDPFRIVYEEVTDGRETFLLKSWRTNITAPRQYALLRGSLDMTTDVVLPDEPLQSTLRRDFSFSSAQVAHLTRLFQRTVAELPAQELIPAYCSADNPQISFAYLAEHHLRVLVRRCSETYSTFDREHLWNFLIKNQEEEELMVEIHTHCHLQFA